MLSVSDQLVLRGVSPAGVQQDQSGPVDLTLIGSGFLPGISASLVAPGGAPQALTTTYVGPGEARVTALAPGALAVGQYDLTLTNVGASPSAPLKFTVTEGAPQLTAIQPGCAVTSPVFSGSASGTFLYPSSVVRVSGNSIVDSPLVTACLSGVDQLGRCVGGLRVTADLSGVLPGTYTATVVNPGSPAPLRSSPQTIQVMASCP
jgi:hypothetical protein